MEHRLSRDVLYFLTRMRSCPCRSGADSTTGNISAQIRRFGYQSPQALAAALLPRQEPADARIEATAPKQFRHPHRPSPTSPLPNPAPHSRCSTLFSLTSTSYHNGCWPTNSGSLNHFAGWISFRGETSAKLGPN